MNKIDKIFFLILAVGILIGMISFEVELIGIDRSNVLFGLAIGIMFGAMFFILGIIVESNKIYEAIENESS